MPLPYAGAGSSNQDLATNKPTTKKGERALQQWREDSPNRQPLVEQSSTVTPQAATLLSLDQLHSSGDLWGTQPETKLAYDPTVPSQSSPSGMFSGSSDLAETLFQAAKSPAPFDPQAVPEARAQLLAAMNPVTDDITNRVVGRGNGAAAQGAVMVQSRENNIDVARAHLDDAMRTERQQAIGANRLGVQSYPGNIAKREDPLTQAEYDAMTPRQRAAVDFNTMLVDAVREDRSQQDEYATSVSPAERRTYDAAVEKLFGEDRGSEMYAPQTLAVLRQVFGDQTDDHGALSDYTSLRAAIGAKDIHSGVLAPGTPADDTRNTRVAEDTGLVESDRATLSDNLARGTQAMERVLARGTSLLNASSIQQALEYERGQDARHLGATEGINLGDGNYLGYGDDEVSVFFRQAFDNLADKSSDLDKKQVLGIVAEKLSPTEFKAFLGYANNRAMMADQYKMPLGTTDGVKYRTPEEFRQLLQGEQPGYLVPGATYQQPSEPAPAREKQGAY